MWNSDAHLKIKLKLLTISSRTYSGRHLKASGCSEGRGSLENELVLVSYLGRIYLLDSFVGSVVGTSGDSEEPDSDISHEEQGFRLH
jgi:hypothetical protein